MVCCGTIMLLCTVRVLDRWQPVSFESLISFHISLSNSSAGEIKSVHMLSSHAGVYFLKAQGLSDCVTDYQLQDKFNLIICLRGKNNCNFQRAFSFTCFTKVATRHHRRNVCCNWNIKQLILHCLQLGSLWLRRSTDSQRKQSVLKVNLVARTSISQLIVFRAGI